MTTGHVGVVSATMDQGDFMGRERPRQTPTRKKKAVNLGGDPIVSAVSCVLVPPCFPQAVLTPRREVDAIAGSFSCSFTVLGAVPT